MRELLIGVWKMVDYGMTAEDGTVHRLWGEGVQGYLIYTAEGIMSATIMMANRAPYAVNDLTEASEGDRAGAAATYVSYAGPFTVESDGVVMHHVELSLVPNWVGMDQLRYVAWEGDRLKLSTLPMGIGGGKMVGSVTWERVGRSIDLAEG